MKDNHDVTVEAWMRELASSADPAAVLPDPDLIWRKAQLRQRLAAEEKATRVIRLTERLGYGACALAASVLLIGSQVQVQGLLQSLAQSSLRLLGVVTVAITLGSGLSLLRAVVSSE